jgi:hypothetical protein
VLVLVLQRVESDGRVVVSCLRLSCECWLRAKASIDFSPIGGEPPDAPARQPQ